MNNLELWNSVKQPPASALKQIMGGRLKGKTDIAPQWRYQEATNQFGPCGMGWKWVIKRVWNEPVADGQVFAFAEIDLFYKQGNTWSEAVPGIGGSMLIEKETNGLHANDEGYKMAITDALSVAFKTLGFASDVYAGMWDGSKYRDATETPTQKPQEVKPATEQTKVGQSHYCHEHNATFFKKGNMKEYAHPIGDTGKWCNESQQHVPPVVEAMQAAVDTHDVRLDKITAGFALLGVKTQAEKSKRIKEWNIDPKDLDSLLEKINDLVDLMNG